MLFGGCDGSGWAFDDTWEWDGATWQALAPTTRPLPRYSPGMCYDTARNVVLLHGGSDPNWGRPFGDTWEWDGAAWRQRFPATSPPGIGHPLVFDSARSRAVNFSGYGTWEWTGTVWLQVGTATVPSVTGPLAYDSARGRTVLCGTNNSTAQMETWEYDGVDWVRMAAPMHPPCRGGHEMVFDAAGARTLLFGGSTGVGSACQGLLCDTWAWDGSVWSSVPTGASPRAIAGHAMASDGARRSLLLFGGFYLNANAGVFSGDTWEWAGPGIGATLTAAGAGCAGSAGVPTLAARPCEYPWLGPVPASMHAPWVGTSFTMHVDNTPPGAAGVLLVGASDVAVRGIGLPLDLSLVGMPTCWLRTSDDVALGLSGFGGLTQVTLPVPAALSLLGARFYGQVLVRDPAANNLGFTLSNSVAGVIGGW